MLKSFVKRSLQVGSDAVAITKGMKFVPAVAAGCAMFATGLASAAVDTAAVDASLTAAQTSGEGVGAKVIGVVAGLAVVGVIIALVRKV